MRPSVQLMADLPEECLSGDVPAFSSVGIDYVGPFATINGRKNEKRYGVIITCLASRAVHIEIAPSLCINSFINALRRFSSSRATVTKIFCDQGTNFIGDSRELREAMAEWNVDVVEDWLKQRQISLKFNTPNSSNFGGIWERLIRSIS